ncbi:carbohydrate ABC transporter permease [Paenibacillus anaericanus]|uniref:Carbohydrate ABC transporter permease n=1 Tax=Paenibacillus anaericanus TaxID=170367 RepID=A0A433XVE5_9BACL|nr:carbohydrate ABC transporter permease [Paenibacillus anaericanus]RUT38607.1 carbohydrate ABC transporter permease [Paenibacillus anaericanus]
MNKDKLTQNSGSDKFYKGFIYVVLIALAVIIIVPVLWAFMSSIKQDGEFYGSPWALPEGIYLQNFADAWLKAKMGSYMLNSVVVTVMALGLLLAVALPASYVLSRFKFKGNGFWNLMFMAGLFINVNYIVVPIFLMLNNGDKVVRSIFGHPILLNNLFILAIVYASMSLSFTIYLMSGYFKSLPKEYEEAASVDGAGYFRTMVQVIMPMAKPSIVTVILFNFLSFWNEYIVSMTLLPKPGFKTLPVGLMNLMAAQKSAVEYGQMYAGLVLVMLPTLILYILVQKKLTQGMTMGGLKG